MGSDGCFEFDGVACYEEEGAVRWSVVDGICEIYLGKFAFDSFCTDEHIVLDGFGRMANILRYSGGDNEQCLVRMIERINK